jgi:DnaJ homolog subfamily B member 4
MRYSPRGHHLDRDRGYDDFFRQGDGTTGDFELFGGPPAAVAPSSSHRDRDTHYGHRTSPQSRSPASQDDSWKPVIEHELPVSLEDMFNGTTLTAQIHRHIPHPLHGGLMDESHSVNIPIGRGLKPGSRIKFRGHGDINPEYGKQDIHFIVREAPHPIFQLKDRDVHATLELSLAMALLGWERNIRTICGKTVRIAHEGPTPPNWKKDFAGLGMCSRRDSNVRGDMIVGVKIVWPKEGCFSEKQKELLRRALMPGTTREARPGGVGVY